MKGFIPKNTHPINYILLLLVYMLGGFFVGNFLSLAVLYVGFDMSLFDLQNVIQNPGNYPQGKMAVNIFQGISHFCAFTLAPIALLLSLGFKLNDYLSPKYTTPLGLFLLAALLIIIIVPANSWLIDFNSKIDFPDSLQWFETWAKEKEESIKELTQFITNFDTTGELLAGLLIFGLIPAIGEELVFRGILQRQLVRWFKNPHVGIWVTAIIFGAIHLQFYGFLPRTLLGALLGYLYFWSGNIWVPIIGHFMNNGFTVFFLYLAQHKLVNYEVESTEAMPVSFILFSILLSMGLIYFLYKQFGVIEEKPVVVERKEGFMEF